MMNTNKHEPLFRRPAFWAASLFISIAIIAVLRISGAINGTTGFILMAAAMLQMIPLTRATTARQSACGAASPAVARYTRGIMWSSFAYALGLGIAVRLNDQMELTGVLAFLVALLPVIPTLAMIWTMGRYLLEERDEYLRHRALIANMVGLGSVLSVGSFWGFLETFNIVPHVPGWWCVPIWAIGMGIGQMWMSLRNRSESGE